MERIKQLYKDENRYYLPGGPVYIDAYALYIDTASGNILAQAKLVSVSDERIIAGKVSFHAYEINGAKKIETVTHSYLDLNVSYGQSFGVKVPVYLPEETRILKASVDEIVYATGDVWRGNGEWRQVPRQEKITHIINSDLLDEWFELTSPNHIFKPSEENGLLLCSCGAIGKKGGRCPQCGFTYHSLSEFMNESFLKHSKDERLQRRAKKEKEDFEKAEREREEKNRQKVIEAQEKERLKEERRCHRTKMLKCGIVFFVICCVLSYAAVTWGIPYYHYKQAKKQADEYNYRHAVAELKQAGSFNDNFEIVVEAALQNIQDGKYEDAIRAYLTLEEYDCSEALFHKLHEEAIALTSTNPNCARTIFEKMPFDDSKQFIVLIDAKEQLNQGFIEVNNAFELRRRLFDNDVLSSEEKEKVRMATDAGFPWHGTYSCGYYYLYFNGVDVYWGDETYVGKCSVVYNFNVHNWEVYEYEGEYDMEPLIPEDGGWYGYLHHYVSVPNIQLPSTFDDYRKQL